MHDSTTFEACELRRRRSTSVCLQNVPLCNVHIFDKY